jgi:hypothetical protein
MSKNVPLKACKNSPKSAYSSAMSIALQNKAPELDALLDGSVSDGNWCHSRHGA